MNPAANAPTEHTSLPSPTAKSPRKVLIEPQEKHYHPAVHFAFVSGILLPLTVLPWYLSKRHTAGLRLRLQQAERKFHGVHLDLRTALLTLDTTRTQQAHLIAQVKEIGKEVENLKATVERIQLDAGRTQELARNELQDEAKALRDSQSGAFSDVGRSLGAVAGFMHELEVHLGLERRGEDGRGIDAVRRAAVRLGNVKEGQRP